jgi:hypothetical protein
LGGGYALITGKVPALLFGGGQYKVEGTPARWIGLLIMSPLPLAFGLDLLAIFLFGRGAAPFLIFGEWLIIILVAITAIVAVRLVRKPVEILSANGSPINESDSEAVKQIARKVQGSTIYLILGATGVGAVIFCPLVFIRTTQALRMIAEQKIGEQYRMQAQIARVISVAVFAVYVCAGIFLLEMFVLTQR